MSIDDASLLTELKETFGLNEDPFSARVNAFYDGAQRRHNLETIRHLSIFGDMVLLLTGDHGSGKTSLIEQFSKCFSDEIEIVRLSAGGGSERIHSVVRLAAISGLEVSQKEPYRDVLEHLVDQYTASFEKNGKRTLIIIDEAHALPEGELSLYLQVIAPLDPEAGVVLLLAGLPSLTSFVTDYEHPDQREWLHQVQLKPLAPAEVDEYLRCRLEAVGFVGHDVVSEEKLAQLVSLAQGNPQSINDYFALVALGKTGGMNTESGDRSNVPQLALFSIALLIVASFLFVSYQHGFFDIEQKDMTAEKQFEVQDLDTLKQKEQRLARIERAIEQTQGSGVSPTISDLEMRDGSIVANTESADLAHEQATVTELDIREADSVEDNPETEKNDSVAERSEASVADSEHSDETELHESAGLAGAKSPVSATPSEVMLPDQSNVVAENIVPEVESGADKPYSRSAKWVLEQSDSAYTAQVLGSYNESTAIKFVKRHIEDASALFYIESRYKGKPWYIVLHGVYPDKSEASSAVKGAARPVRQQKPWLRSYKGIKESLPPL